MKMTIYFFLFLASGSIYADGVVVNTIVTLGRKTQNCSGFGICTIEVATNQMPTGCISGSLMLSDSQMILEVSLSANDIKKNNPDYFSAFDNKSTINFEEDFIVSKEIQDILKSSKTIVIPKGNWKQSYKNGFFIVEIPLL